MTQTKRYIGIGKCNNDINWYYISILLYNRMLKIAFYTPKYKTPRVYWYNKKSFEYNFIEMEGEFKWFIGLTIN